MAARFATLVVVLVAVSPVTLRNGGSAEEPKDSAADRAGFTCREAAVFFFSRSAT